LAWEKTSDAYSPQTSQWPYFRELPPVLRQGVPVRGEQVPLLRFCHAVLQPCLVLRRIPHDVGWVRIGFDDVQQVIIGKSFRVNKVICKSPLFILVYSLEECRFLFQFLFCHFPVVYDFVYWEYSFYLVQAST